MRGLRWLLVVLLILVVLLVVADRVGAWMAQRTVADQVAAELADRDVESAPPEVTIHGWPFLSQVGAGRYEEVTVVIRDAAIDGIQVSQLELIATDVRAAAGDLLAGEGPITADRVEGEVLIGYADVVELAGVEGLELTPAGDAAVNVRLPAELAGQEVTLTGTAGVSVADHTVALRMEELAVEDAEELPDGAEELVEQTVTDVRDRLALDLSLPELPYGLTVESVEVRPDGVVVTAAATDVPIA